MKKLSCFFVVCASIHCYSQSYETKFIEPPITEISCEGFLPLSNFEKINSVNSLLHFKIKSGALYVSARCIIERSATRILINTYVKESMANELLIIATSDSQEFQYRMADAGSGSYGGTFSNDGMYIVNTGFKITSPGQPAFILVLPIRIQLSLFENSHFAPCYVDGAAQLYKSRKTKARKRGNYTR